MSKEQAAAGGKGPEKDGEIEEEEFTMIETDDTGKPVKGADPVDDSDKDDDDDIDDSDKDDDDDGEVRAGHTEGDQIGEHDGETAEERRERRKRENRTKRVRNRVAASSKERLIQQQAELIHTLNDRMAKLEGHTVARDAGLLQDKLAQIESQQAEAKRTLTACGKAGDFEGVAEVTEIQMQLRDQHRNVSIALQRAKNAAGKRRADDGVTDEDGDPAERPTAKPPARRPIPPAVKQRAEAWAAKHSWLNSETNPEEAEIVRAIDRNLAREGWDPTGDDYWTELTSRVKRRLPNRFSKKSANGGGRRETVDGEDTGVKPPAGGPRMAQSSQSSGGHRPLKPGEVYISPQRKEAMKEAGAWDDPAKRKRMLASYAKYDKEHATDRA